MTARGFRLLPLSIACCAALSSGPPAACAQTLADEVRSLRLELERLRQEVETLKSERREPARPAAPAAPPAQEAPGVEVIPVLQAQLAEQAQTKVESNSKLPVKLFGNIVSNTFFNTGEANWLDIPNLVGPNPGSSLPRGSFSSTLRQSRLGATIEGPTIGSAKASGFFALDFFGGITNFQTGQTMGIPRLLYAFVRLEGDKTALEVGQDQMILAPKNPTSLAAMAFPDLYRSGNLYLRVPQARLERRVSAGDLGEFQLTGGNLAPIGGDLSATALTFVPPNLAGERSRRPALQARIAWSRKRNDRGWELGFSGHTGSERYATGSRRSWAGAVDFDASAGRFGVGGEWFVGRNIDAFGGSLGQLAKSAGGFAEARLRATSRFELNAGYGLDRLFDQIAFPAPLARNASVFANTIYHFTPEVAASFEYRWLVTRPSTGESRRNNHFNLVLAYTF